jgi:hypothetical protein
VIDDLVIGMAGSGGDGIVSAGKSLISACAAIGHHAMMTKSFGSQIRGGESFCRVRLTTGPVLNPGGALGIAIALNGEDFFKFGAELPVDAVGLQGRQGFRPSTRQRAPGKDAAASFKREAPLHDIIVSWLSPPSRRGSNPPRP